MMANMAHNTVIFDSIKKDDTNIKQDEDNSMAKPSSSITDENELDVSTIPGDQNLQKREYHHAVITKSRIKPVENGISNFLKLKCFFEMVQKQHPESQLELQQVEGLWKVWCGVCKKLLRPDKSGKAMHNIQRQHFSSVRHQKKLQKALQLEEEVECVKQIASAKDSVLPDIEHPDVKD